MHRHLQCINHGNMVGTVSKDNEEKNTTYNKKFQTLREKEYHKYMVAFFVTLMRVSVVSIPAKVCLCVQRHVSRHILSQGMPRVKCVCVLSVVEHIVLFSCCSILLPSIAYTLSQYVTSLMRISRKIRNNDRRIQLANF